jgi:hypothetical protein
MKELAASPNAKIIMMGKSGTPVILDGKTKLVPRDIQTSIIKNSRELFYCTENFFFHHLRSNQSNPIVLNTSHP